MGWTVSRSCLQHHSGEGGEANGRLILVFFLTLVQVMDWCRRTTGHY